MSSPLTPEIYAAAARSIGWPPIARIWPSDLQFLIATHHLTIDWIEGYVMVKQAGNVGHVERVGADRGVTLFNAVVMCSAMIGGVGR